MSTEERQRPSDADIKIMRSIEADFRNTTGFKDRSQYKIFYTPVWRAKIVLLGINPSGNPDNIAPDGVHILDGSSGKAASSSGYYENGENDLIDCIWPENAGLLKLLVPLLGSREMIRRDVVKTNMAFARSGKARNKPFIEKAKDTAAPFLQQILGYVDPQLILLAGVKLTDFTSRHCTEFVELERRREVQSVHQTVIWPARVQLLGGRSCIAIEVAHASQFSWTYEKHDVSFKIKAIVNDIHSAASGA